MLFRSREEATSTSPTKSKNPNYLGWTPSKYRAHSYRCYHAPPAVTLARELLPLMLMKKRDRSNQRQILRVIPTHAGLVRAERKFFGPGDDHPQRLEKPLGVLMQSFDLLVVALNSDVLPAALDDWINTASGRSSSRETQAR